MIGGRPNEKYSQALRLLKIHELLQHRGQITIAELMNEFSITSRTVQRDMATLQEAYAIEEGERTDTNEKTFRIKTGLRAEILKLTITEMLALYMGRNMFAFTEGTELKAAMDSLYEKLAARLCAHNVDHHKKLPKKLYCTSGFPKTYKASADVLNALLTGLLDENKVAVRYALVGKEPYRDVLHPYTLVVNNNALYIVAFSEHSQDRRTYAVERIKRAEWLRGEPFEYPERYDPDVVLKAAFGIAAGHSPVKVRLHFSPAVAPYVSSRRWHKSMTTKSRKGGGLEVCMTVSLSYELVHWLTGYGPDVQVLAPKELREKVRARHAAAFRNPRKVRAA